MSTYFFNKIVELFDAVTGYMYIIYFSIEIFCRFTVLLYITLNILPIFYIIILHHNLYVISMVANFTLIIY